MSKQRPDPDKMANELAGASSFFKPRAASVPTERVASESPVETTPESVTSRRRDVTTSPEEGFDINRETATHDTLRLATDESRALEELKSALKWDHDLTVSKNDICRAALHELIERYRRDGAGSPAVQRLHRKRGRQSTTS
jgi:hypothetical protein